MKKNKIKQPKLVKIKLFNAINLFNYNYHTNLVKMITFTVHKMYTYVNLLSVKAATQRLQAELCLNKTNGAV